MGADNCPSCGKVVPSGATHCDHCDGRITPTAAESADETTDSAADWLEAPGDHITQFHEDPTTGHPSVFAAGDEGDTLSGEASGAADSSQQMPEPPAPEGVALSASQLRRVALLRERLESSGPDASTVLNIGRVHEEAHDLRGALHYYEIGLELDPGNRYASERISALQMQAPSDELPKRATTTGARNTTTGRTSRPGSSRRIARRRRTSNALFASILALAAVFAITGMVLLTRDRAPTEHIVSQPGRGIAEAAFSPDGKLLAFIELPPQLKKDSILWGIWDGVEGTVQVHDLLRRTTVASFPDARLPPDGRALTWGGPQRLAYGTTEGRIAIVDLTGAEPTVHVNGSNPSFSPDGHVLALDRRVEAPVLEESADAVAEPPTREIVLHDLRTGEERQLSESGGRRPRFSPAGDRVAFERDGAVFVAPATGGIPTMLVGHGHDHSPRWVAGGSALSWLRRGTDPGRRRSIIEDQLWLAEPDGTGAHEVLSFYEHDALALSTASWSPDGRFALYLALSQGRVGIVIHPERGLIAGGLDDRVDLFLRDVENGLTYPIASSGDGATRGNPLLGPKGTFFAYTALVNGVPELHVTPWSPPL